MPLDEAVLKRQLDRATEDLAAWIKVLDGESTAVADRRKNAKWRQLNATCNAIRLRMRSVAAVVTRDEEAAKRKAEKLAVPPEEKVSKKAGKGAKADGKAKGKDKAAKKPAKGAEGKAPEGKAPAAKAPAAKESKGGEGKEKKKKES
jgi:hypothetical protein